MSSRQKRTDTGSRKQVASKLIRETARVVTRKKGDFKGQGWRRALVTSWAAQQKTAEEGR